MLDGAQIFWAAVTLEGRQNRSGIARKRFDGTVELSSSFGLVVGYLPARSERIIGRDLARLEPRRDPQTGQPNRSIKLPSVNVAAIEQGIEDGRVDITGHVLSRVAGL